MKQKNNYIPYKLGYECIRLILTSTQLKQFWKLSLKQISGLNGNRTRTLRLPVQPEFFFSGLIFTTA